MLEQTFSIVRLVYKLILDILYDCKVKILTQCMPVWGIMITLAAIVKKQKVVL